MAEKFTWDDLMKAIEEIPQEYRNNQVFFSFEDRDELIKVDSIQTVPEDIYSYKDHEEFGTFENMKEFAEMNDEEFNEKNIELITKKGIPFLWDGF
jgi:hypothetical protein